MNETFNVVISSKNKYSGDTNSSVTVKLKEDIYVANNEELYVCMQLFHTVKSFYNCQSGLNDHFQVIYRIPDIPEPIETFDIHLPEGNYDVNSLKKQIQLETNNALFDISYVPRLNKYLYKKLVAQNPNPNIPNPFEFDVYIKCISAGIFLGFENGVEYKINSTGTYSSKFINISGYNQMILKLIGDVNIENTVSNIYGTGYNFDKILGILNISGTAAMDSIIYEEQGACMFKHKVNNSKVNEFSIQIVNENGIVFPEMADWILVLKFEKVMPGKDMQGVTDLLKDINYFAASMYSYLEVPSRLTIEDVLNR